MAEPEKELTDIQRVVAALERIANILDDISGTFVEVTDPVSLGTRVLLIRKED
jgi:hypothetical protein